MKNAMENDQKPDEGGFEEIKDRFRVPKSSWDGPVEAFASIVAEASKTPAGTAHWWSA